MDEQDTPGAFGNYSRAFTRSGVSVMWAEGPPITESGSAAAFDIKTGSTQIDFD